MTDLLDGGCFCGAVRYRAAGSPRRVSLCSCTWCRKRTGSVLGVSVYFRKSDVQFLAGNMSHYRLTSDAGRWLKTGFCPTCGTTLGWTLELFPDYQGLSGGTFDSLMPWRPERYVFMRSKPDWLTVGCELSGYEAMPT